MEIGHIDRHALLHSPQPKNGTDAAAAPPPPSPTGPVWSEEEDHQHQQELSEEELQSLEPLIARRSASVQPPSDSRDGDRTTTEEYGVFRPMTPTLEHKLQTLQPVAAQGHDFQSLAPTEGYEFQTLEPVEGQTFQAPRPTEGYEFQTEADGYQFQTLTSDSSGVFETAPTAPERFWPPSTAGGEMSHPLPTTSESLEVLKSAGGSQDIFRPLPVTYWGDLQSPLPTAEGPYRPPPQTTTEDERLWPPPTAGGFQPLMTKQRETQKAAPSTGEILWTAPSSQEDSDLATTQGTYWPVLDAQEARQTLSTPQDMFRPLPTVAKSVYQPPVSSSRITFQPSPTVAQDAFQSPAPTDRGVFQPPSVISPGNFQPVTIAGPDTERPPGVASGPGLFRAPPAAVVVGGGSFRPLYPASPPPLQPQPPAPVPPPSGPAPLEVASLGVAETTFSHRQRGRRPAPQPLSDSASGGGSPALWSPLAPVQSESRRLPRPPQLEWGSFRPIAAPGGRR